MGHLELQSLTGNATLLSTRQATVGDWPRLSLLSKSGSKDPARRLPLRVIQQEKPLPERIPRTANPAPGPTESGTGQGTRGLLEVQPHHCTDGKTEAQRHKRISPGPAGNPWGGGGWTSTCSEDPQVAHTVLSIAHLEPGVRLKQPFR